MAKEDFGITSHHFCLEKIYILFPSSLYMTDIIFG